jgi:uncharacterized protein YPO0396
MLDRINGIAKDLILTERERIKEVDNKINLIKSQQETQKRIDILNERSEALRELFERIIEEESKEVEKEIGIENHD